MTYQHNHEATKDASLLFKQMLIGGLVVYQKTLSYALGPRCRFYPSCSQYAKECIQTYPLSIAVLRSLRRLLSCHPFHPGGVDLP